MAARVSGTGSSSAGPDAGSLRAALAWRPHVPTLLMLCVAATGLFGPFVAGGDALLPAGSGLAIGCVALLVAALVPSGLGGPWTVPLATPLAVSAAFLALLAQRGLAGPAGWGYWLTLLGSLVAAATAAGRVSVIELESDAPRWQHRVQRLVPAATVAFLVLLAWEGLVVGSRVPKGIFPRVSDIWLAFLGTWRVLLADAYLTFVKEVLFGFAVGLTLGFLVGSAIAFSRFLQRGFLPLATAFGAVPIVGLAPVLGRALGVDWESKAAVVVIVTFFPVVLNTVQGLTLVDPLKLELLRSYGARPLTVFLKLRVPNALPYVFNALKVAVVVGVVSVIVAEFLIPGPPNGLGQRISLSAHRGAFDIVFAAILVSSLISMALYWAVGLLERAFTAWHPSTRGS
ncbi:MAG: ABC transporter permease [Trueperaceae bacterium]|nr:ABC transporter permease [Trueperaceae bacterium]MCO5173490.1 ABC transporter permease [Trueperaceae bacterium]MCW5820250.1 ABC transporter permease [Trueperaceae bacterium]